MTDPNPPSVDLANTTDFMLGALKVRPSFRSIEIGENTVTLEPRIMQVFVVLAEHAGTPVTRDELIARCWSGVIVGDDAIQRCIGRLRRVAESVGGFEIETFSKIGYRLSVISPDTDGRVPQLRSAKNEDRRPRVGFANLQIHSKLGRDETFAELLADDVTAALSLNRELQVSARAPLARETSDIREIGQALGAQYLVMSRFRRSGNFAQLRLQLTFAETRRILWTYEVDGVLLDVEIPSDDLVVDLASRIATELIREETDRVLRKTEDLTAWEAVIRANAAYQRINLDSLSFATEEARRAVAIDPGYGAAQAALANALAATYELRGGQDAELAIEARRHCDLALAADQDNPTVLAWVSNALGMITRPAEGLAHCERAIELAPTHPIAHLYIARQYLYNGRAEEALAALASHNRVAPRFPWQYYVAFNQGIAQFMAGQTDQAERSFDRAVLLNPDYPYSWIAKTILCSVLGRPEDAQQAAARLKIVDGDGTLDLQLARVAHSYPDQSVSKPLQDALRSAWNS